MMSDLNYKVLVLGLDGATFDLMLPWIDEGHLPNLGRLVREGAWGRLESTIPPHTPCAWSSFMTGKNPGKHGLFEFSEPVPGSYRFRFTNAATRKAESLWSILSRAGKRVGVVNVPMTYPPEKVNGYLVSGLDTPHEFSQFTSPTDLRQELQQKSLPYQIDLQHMGNMRSDAKRDAALDQLRQMETHRTRAFEYLSKQYPADFRMIVYTATDRVQHHFWHYMDPRHDHYDATGAPRYQHAIRDVYKHLDGLVGQLLDEIDENTIVMVMSDHGFGPTTNVRLQLNRALAESKLLSFTKEGGLRRLVRGVASFADRVLRSTLPSGAKKLIAGLFPKMRAGFESLDEAKLDWQHTKSYTNEAFRTCPGIWVNKAPDRPEGTVWGDAAAEETIKATQQSLQSLVDPQTGRPVVSHVYRTDEIYHGPHTSKAPALLPSWWEDGFVLEQSEPGSKTAVRRSKEPIEGGVEFTGGHRLDGVFIMAGGPVKRGVELKGCHITDVAPTVLYLMGQPIPADMDGKVLSAGIEQSFVVEHKPMTDGPEQRQEDDAGSSDFSDEESGLIAERLKALGYI